MGLITKACGDREIISIYKLVKYILKKIKIFVGHSEDDVEMLYLLDRV